MIQVVDAHYHLWDLSLLDYPWLASGDSLGLLGDYTAIRRSYLATEYRAESRKYQVVGSVHIQADVAPAMAIRETEWLHGLPASAKPDAVVAFCDLSAPDARRKLEAHCAFGNVRGIRQILSRHADPLRNFAEANHLGDAKWIDGVALLEQFGLSFDLHIYPHQMRDAALVVARYPHVQFILNHTGMPADQSAEGLREWRNGLDDLAQCDNVAIKISGLGMLSHHWTLARIQPIVIDAIKIFGAHRCMFASNFPVDKLFISFDSIWDNFLHILTNANTDPGDVDRLLHRNARRIYRF